MFFLLRCAFWLLIVYASILLPHHMVRDVIHETADASSSAASQITQKALATAADYCGHAGTKCLDQAGRLTALIERTQGGEPEQAKSGLVEAQNVPVPVARPRNISQGPLTHAVGANR